MKEHYYSHESVYPFSRQYQSYNNNNDSDLKEAYRLSSKYHLNSTINAPLANIINDCKKNNIEIPKINSGYRSYCSQLKLYIRILHEKQDLDQTIQRAAPPLYSEHHSGLALDCSNLTDENIKVLTNHGFIKSKSQKAKSIDEYWHWVHEKAFKQYQHKAFHGGSNNGINYSSVPSIGEIQRNREGAIRDLELFHNLSNETNNNTAELLLENTKREFNIKNIDDQIFHTQLLSIVLPGTLSPTIKTIQKLLIELGYDTLATGLYGNKTNAALKEFCKNERIYYPECLTIQIAKRIESVSCTACQYSIPDLESLLNTQAVKADKQFIARDLRKIKRIRRPEQVNDNHTLYLLNNEDKLIEKWSNNGSSSSLENKDKKIVTDSEELCIELVRKGYNAVYNKSIRGFLYKAAEVIKEKQASINIAITGSCGKTTTKEFVYSLLRDEGHTVKTPGSANSLYAVSISIANAPLSTKYHVIECGLGAGGSSLKHISRLISPDIAIVTCVKEAHLEGYADLNELRSKKLDIAEYLDKNGFLIIDGDDQDLINAAIIRYGDKCTILHVGNSTGCDVLIKNEKFVSNMMQISIKGQEKFFKTNSLGYQQQKAIGFSLLTRCLLGLGIDNCEKIIENLSIPSGRGNIIGKIGAKISLFDSHYNANPASMEEDLITFNSLVDQQNNSIKTIAIIGDMAELGQNSVELHQQTIEKINNTNFDQVFIVGTCFRSFSHLFTSKLSLFDNNLDLINNLEQLINCKPFIFLKGSNNNNLNEISVYLHKKISRSQ